MKNFLAVYMGTPNSRQAKWDSLNDAQRKQMEVTGIKAWGDWMVKHQSVIVVAGGPLGKTKQVSPKGIVDIKNEMTGYVVVKAESHADAAKLFENHPHFAIFPGDAVEIMEVLPIPGM